MINKLELLVSKFFILMNKLDKKWNDYMTNRWNSFCDNKNIWNSKQNTEKEYLKEYIENSSSNMIVINSDQMRLLFHEKEFKKRGYEDNNYYYFSFKGSKNYKEIRVAKC